jgi:hypothetical protein
MDYGLKANITTVLSFCLMPVLASFGVDVVTGNAIFSIIAIVLCFLLMFLNERYLSGIFTKSGYSVVEESNIPAQVEDTTPESAVNPEYECDEGA